MRLGHSRTGDRVAAAFFALAQECRCASRADSGYCGRHARVSHCLRCIWGTGADVGRHRARNCGRECRKEHTLVNRDSDEPIVDPDHDLLGLDPHARRLACQILDKPTPYTIGVYGEWGAGKTTFVNLLRWHLDQLKTNRPEFIRFEAWPH